MFYLTTHSTHFIYGYMASESPESQKDCSMVQKHTRNIREEKQLIFSLYNLLDIPEECMRIVKT